MNFELKHLDLIGAADEKADVLVLLLPKDFKGGKDDLSTLIATSLKSGDMETSSGNTLSM